MSEKEYLNLVNSLCLIKYRMLKMCNCSQDLENLEFINKIRQNIDELLINLPFYFRTITAKKSGRKS